MNRPIAISPFLLDSTLTSVATAASSWAERLKSGPSLSDSERVRFSADMIALSSMLEALAERNPLE